MCLICERSRTQTGRTPTFSQPTGSGLLTRRRLLGAGLFAAATPALAKKKSALETPPNAISPEEALKRLMDGNARYVAGNPNERDFSAGRAARVNVQYPIAGLVSCADARLTPELALDQGIGELFVTRVAGNFIGAGVLGSLEYGVAVLGMPLIMVLGHTNCGAIGAALKVIKSGEMLPGHLDELITSVKPAAIQALKKSDPDDQLNWAITANVKRQVATLKNRPSLVQKAWRAKKVDIVGGVYDLATGKIELVPAG
jgi:carbonic anhydrase